MTLLRYIERTCFLILLLSCSRADSKLASATAPAEGVSTTLQGTGPIEILSIDTERGGFGVSREAVPGELVHAYNRVAGLVQIGMYPALFVEEYAVPDLGELSLGEADFTASTAVPCSLFVPHGRYEGLVRTGRYVPSQTIPVYSAYDGFAQVSEDEWVSKYCLNGIQAADPTTCMMSAQTGSDNIYETACYPNITAIEKRRLRPILRMIRKAFEQGRYEVAYTGTNSGSFIPRIELSEGNLKHLMLLWEKNGLGEFGFIYVPDGGNTFNHIPLAEYREKQESYRAKWAPLFDELRQRFPIFDQVGGLRAGLDIPFDESLETLELYAEEISIAYEIEVGVLSRYYRTNESRFVDQNIIRTGTGNDNAHVSRREEGEVFFSHTHIHDGNISEHGVYAQRGASGALSLVNDTIVVAKSADLWSAFSSDEDTIRVRAYGETIIVNLSDLLAEAIRIRTSYGEATVELVFPE